jgi:hypothetical protein
VILKYKCLRNSFMHFFRSNVVNWLSIIHVIGKINLCRKFGNYSLVDAAVSAPKTWIFSITGLVLYMWICYRQMDVMNDVMRDSDGTSNADCCNLSTFHNSRLLGIKCSVNCPGPFQYLWRCLHLVVWMEFCLHRVVFFLLALRRATCLPFSHSSIYASLHQYLHSSSR